MLARRKRSDSMYQSMVLYAHMADAEIVEKVRSGAKDCYEVLMRRYTQALYRIGRMFDFSSRDIEDLVSDTHGEAFRTLHAYDRSQSYRTWLTRLMIDRCSRRVESLPAPGVGAEPAGGGWAHGTSAPEWEAASEREAELETLPVPLRRLFVLREVEGFSEKETAGLLNLSEDCVKQGTQRAKLSVRKSLRRNFFGDTLYPIATSSADRVVQRVMAAL